MKRTDLKVSVQINRSTALMPAVVFIVTLIGFCQTGLAQGQGSGRTPAIACEQLRAVKLKDVSSITAQPVSAGTFTQPGGPGNAPLNNLPAFCRVSLVIKPQINIEVWLPMAWNERFQAVGGGGYAGSISWGALATAIRNGYATESTETGQSGATQPGGSFALNYDGFTITKLIDDLAFC